MFNLFSDTSSDVPSIGGIAADVTSADDIISGKAKADDYGRGVGAGIGAFFGAPEEGAQIGGAVLPILNKYAKPAAENAWGGIWDAISK